MGAIQFLVDLGLLDVILPFMLVFTITYAVLQKTKILGVEGKNNLPKSKLNALLSFVMGFFAVLATSLLKTINIILAYLVLLLVIGLMLALVFGLAGAETGKKNKLFVAIMLVLLILFVFLGLVQSGVIDRDRFWSTIFLPVVVLAVIALVIYYMVGKKEEEGPEPEPTPPPTPPPGSG